MKTRLALYYRLTKPGIIYGNALPTVATFCLASADNFKWLAFAGVLLGQSLIIASACVYNNYFDRRIDALMERTKNRAIPTGRVSGRAALIYGSLLGLIGAGALILTTNLITLLVGAAGWLTYVVAYGITKRRGPYGTLVGSIAGAMPPVAGYTAVTGQLDATAVVLFVALAAWQMPHFYAIAIYRQADYEAAGIPVLPAQRGHAVTRRSMAIYATMFTLACATLTLIGPTGYIYLAVMTVLGAAWVYRIVAGYRATDDARWARGVFGYSLKVLLGFSLMTALGGRLP